MVPSKVHRRNTAAQPSSMLQANPRECLMLQFDIDKTSLPFQSKSSARAFANIDVTWPILVASSLPRQPGIPGPSQPVSFPSFLVSGVSKSPEALTPSLVAFSISTSSITTLRAPAYAHTPCHAWLNCDRRISTCPISLTSTACRPIRRNWQSSMVQRPSAAAMIPTSQVSSTMHLESVSHPVLPSTQKAANPKSYLPPSVTLTLLKWSRALQTDRTCVWSFKKVTWPRPTIVKSWVTSWGTSAGHW